MMYSYATYLRVRVTREVCANCEWADECQNHGHCEKCRDYEERLEDEYDE